MFKKEIKQEERERERNGKKRRDIKRKKHKKTDILREKCKQDYMADN